MSNTGIYYDDSDSEAERGSRYRADSDEESLVDVDSPADGYFERREHPQTNFVPNPAVSTQERSEEDKAREAARERQEHEARQEGGSGNERERQRPPSHPSQRSPVWGANEHTPLLDAGPAGPPPDYAAATADRRRYHGREGSGSSYGSVSDSAFSSDHPLVRNGLTNEQGVFGSRAQPESMRDSPTPGSRERSGLRGGGHDEEAVDREEIGFVRRQGDRDWNGRKRWTRHFRAKRIFTWITVFGILVLILLVSGAFEDAQQNGKYPSGGNGRNAPDEPSGPDDDGGDHEPAKDGPIPPHRQTTQCPYHAFSKPESFSFRAPNFTFIESIEGVTERDLFNDRISGTVQVSAAPDTQSEPIVVWVSVALSGPWKFMGLRKVMDDEVLEILFPEVNTGERIGSYVSSTGRWKTDEHSCMDISVGLTVKPGTKLEALDLYTSNLDVRVEHGVFDEVDDRAEENTSIGPALKDLEAMNVKTVRGKVQADYLSSRRTYIETTSSSISGTYALRDSLRVKSTSGSINLNVDPKDADEDDPQPADFHASSNSGSITVEYPTFGSDIPDRDYRTTVETGSSQIKGAYIFTSQASFDTNSGQQNLRLLPYTPSKGATLHTSSGSAQTKLTLLGPYTAPSSHNPRAGLLDHLSSSHSATSGSLHLVYPDEWQGVIDGESNSGSISIRGEDVEIIVDEDLGKGVPGAGVLKQVTARKGWGRSRMSFRTTSGSVDVLAGEE